MTRQDRDRILDRFRAQIASGRPIIGAGAGTGLSARCAESGGADLVIIYNSGRYRMAGRAPLGGLMPYGDANTIVVEMGHEVLPVVSEIPVVAGVCATDPFRDMAKFVDDLAGMGFAGVQNYPTVGLIDGVFRENLEAAGIGFGLEVDMIATAASHGLLTCPYVFDPAQAAEMTRAGADVLIAHLGLMATNTAGPSTELSFERAAERIQAMRDAAIAVNPGIIVLCHGQPVDDPDDVARILRLTEGVAGFFGSTSLEGLPIQHALTEKVRTFKSITAG
jgi:predicted TIM-barrel enzyme